MNPMKPIVTFCLLIFVYEAHNGNALKILHILGDEHEMFCRNVTTYFLETRIYCALQCGTELDRCTHIHFNNTVERCLLLKSCLELDTVSANGSAATSANASATSSNISTAHASADVSSGTWASSSSSSSSSSSGGASASASASASAAVSAVNLTGNENYFRGLVNLVK